MVPGLPCGLGEALNAAGAPEAAELLMTALRTPEPDLGLARGLRQFGGHRPGAAKRAFL